MFNKFFLLVVAVVCFANAGYAQHKPCSTDEHYWQLLEKYPQLADYQKQFDEQTERIIAERTSSTTPDTTTYDIPIVIHIIHDYGVEDLADTVLVLVAHRCLFTLYLPAILSI